MTTISTTIVTTVIFPQRPLPILQPGESEDVAWSYAYDDRERRELIREITTYLDGHEYRTCDIYNWDRPCRSSTVCTYDEFAGGNVLMDVREREFPQEGLHLVTDLDHGALVFTGEGDEGRGRYISVNPDPLQAPPITRYDLGGDGLFPRVSMLPLTQVHATAGEYILTGRRPGNVGWKLLKNDDLPRLDPRW